MQRLVLLLVIVSQIIIGADTDKVSQQVLDITREQYQLLENLAQNEQAVDIICRIKGRDLKQLIQEGYADIDYMQERHRDNNICLKELYDETMAMYNNIDFLQKLIAHWDKAETLLAQTAKRLDRLFVLGQNKEMAEIVVKAMRTAPETLAQNLLLSLSRIAEEFEDGKISVCEVEEITTSMISCVDGIISHAQKKSLCIPKKGKHGKSGIRRANIS